MESLPIEGSESILETTLSGSYNPRDELNNSVVDGSAFMLVLCILGHVLGDNSYVCRYCMRNVLSVKVKCTTSVVAVDAVLSVVALGQYGLRDVVANLSEPGPICPD